MKLEISPGSASPAGSAACAATGWRLWSPAEVERYRQVGAARFYDDDDGGDVDPFEPVDHWPLRIRRRADGACGFLSGDNRCRIHEDTRTRGRGRAAAVAGGRRGRLAARLSMPDGALIGLQVRPRCGSPFVSKQLRFAV